jgi:uncharacterized membrane protein YeaQ/YmgE (transglycosylase-associated protein family)
LAVGIVGAIVVQVRPNRTRRRELYFLPRGAWNYRKLCALAYGAPGPGRVQCKSVHCESLRAMRFGHLTHAKASVMNNIVYIVGAIVIIAILSFFGLR